MNEAKLNHVINKVHKVHSTLNNYFNWSVLGPVKKEEGKCIPKRKIWLLCCLCGKIKIFMLSKETVCIKKQLKLRYVIFIVIPLNIMGI